MPKVKPKAKVKTKRKKQGSKTGASAVYRGRQARTGNSLALRFDRALFQSHPEFNGEVEARVIGKGRMLVTAEVGKANEEDPVLSSFMSFLSADMERSPEHIRPLDSSLMKRIAKLVQGVEVTGDEALGNEATI